MEWVTQQRKDTCHRLVCHLPQSCCTATALSPFFTFTVSLPYFNLYLKAFALLPPSITNHTLPIIHCLAVVDNYGQQSGSVRTMVVFRQRWFCNNRCDPKMVQRSKDGLFCNDSCTVTTVARQGRSSSNCPEAGSVDQATGLP